MQTNKLITHSSPIQKMLWNLLSSVINLSVLRLLRSLFGVESLAIKAKQFLYRQWGFQKVESTRFQVNWHMKVVRMLTLRIDRLYSQEILLVFIFVARWVYPRLIVRSEGICQWEIPVAPSGIKPATFRLGTQCLKQLRYHLPHRNKLKLRSGVRCVPRTRN